MCFGLVEYVPRLLVSIAALSSHSFMWFLPSSVFDLFPRSASVVFWFQVLSVPGCALFAVGVLGSGVGRCWCLMCCLGLVSRWPGPSRLRTVNLSTEIKRGAVAVAWGLVPALEVIGYPARHANPTLAPLTAMQNLKPLSNPCLAPWSQ